MGAVCVKFIYGPKIPKKAPKDPRGTPEGAPRRPDAAPKTVPRRVKIASRWPAGILRGGRRARKIHRMPQRPQEGSEGASRGLLEELLHLGNLALVRNAEVVCGIHVALAMGLLQELSGPVQVVP